ncbi:unnamed protein product [Rotaria sp. Silwood2]|nr:unnamed protein product [Rotaria sp. Silwood2]
MSKYILVFLISILLELFFVPQCLTQTNDVFEAFSQQDETSYIDAFSTLIKDSYSVPLPQGLAAACKNQNQVTATTVKSITTSMLSSNLQIFCGTETICTIPADFTVTMNSNLNIAALVLSGSLTWNDISQTSSDQWLCAGYIAVNGGQFNMNLTSKQGYIYIKNNGLKHTTIYTRAFGAYNAGKIHVSGRPLARTWSLLANRGTYGMSSISLLHKPEDMGWRVGDRIVIAPTMTSSRGNAEDYTIGGFEANNTIKLLNKDGTSSGIISSIFESKALFTGENMTALMQAEIINLSRNIIITGDDFQHVNCVNDVASGKPSDSAQADHCSCWTNINRNKCTLGLHTIAIGPGTDNDQSDTTLNQAGLWGLSFTNYAIGNRFANNYNGMLYQEQGFESGRGQLSGLECLSFQRIGRLEGNTFHGCGRFGTYVLANVFPKKTDRSVDKNGLPTLSTCREWTTNGEDNGLPATFMHNIDYGNVFVGQYNAGDLQYRFHTSIENNNLIYWKETKNFQDGCSSHIADSFYGSGNLALPGGHGAFILENMVFNNQVHFESSHHCQIGVTGVLCMPTYVFVNMKWTGVISDEFSLLKWGPNNGAMFTLGPDEEQNLTGNKLFPAGFCSIAHSYWSYLLALDNGTSCFSSNDVARLLGQDTVKFARKYDGGAIFCKRSVRRLEIFSFGQSSTNHRTMQLELWQYDNLISSVTLNFFQIGDRKQGYSATVIPGLDHKYKLSMTGGGDVPPDWIIEFSDPIFGNRWKRDEIALFVVGRNCSYPVHSQHDRRYIWSGDNYLTVKGRGACTSFPDMPPVNCRSQPKLSNVEYCSDKCSNGCTNGYCDCATGECLCNPGFSGSNCNIDTCAAAGCVHGNCAARYLGQHLPVTNKPCVCIEGWYGDRCDTPTPPPPLLEPEPTCFNGCYFFMDTDIAGGNLEVIQTSNPKTCCDACQANAVCNSWVLAGVCFLKTGTQRIHKSGIISGLKCSAGIGSSTIVSSTTAAVTSNCDSKCKGKYPHGCNAGFQVGYCNAGGGCTYSITTDPNWCCFKGCDQQSTVTNPLVLTTVPADASTTVTVATISAPCDGKCRGNYPYGCNSDFSTGYCAAWGGCSYSTMNDPQWCCFKGC